MRKDKSTHFQACVVTHAQSRHTPTEDEYVDLPGASAHRNDSDDAHEIFENY